MTTPLSPFAEPAEFLEWDSAFFGRRIARMRGDSLNEAGAVLEWCAANRIECLYFLGVPDAATIAEAERHAFSFVDIRVTYERDLAPLPEAPAGIREATAGDVERLKQITGRNFIDSRFYSDSHFDRAQCDALYAAWIEHSCDGYANRVLVASRDGEVAGYVTCNLAGDTGNIGLIAVDPAAHGQGLGRGLVIAALHYFAAEGMTRSTVVTQGRNIASQRLYQRCGYLLKSTQLWYHRWFTP
jgi:dTDP-4-amino-4,6-dideoxy-D-galactose acyltransferase